MRNGIVMKEGVRCNDAHTTVDTLLSMTVDKTRALLALVVSILDVAIQVGAPLILEHFLSPAHSSYFCFLLTLV